MGEKMAMISGTEFDINGIQKLGEFNANSKGVVVEFNKYGYIGVKVDGRDDIVKRHLSDCEDLRSMVLGSSIRNLVFEDGRWIVVHDGHEIPSSDVYIIKFYNQCGEDVYLSRSSADGHATLDITKAWFTFIKEQAVNYASKKSIMNMRAYTAVNVEDIIKIQRYEQT